MQLTEIKISNIRGITDCELSPKKVNYIVGPSGSGKSSFMNALAFGITGNLPKEVIRTGTSVGSISITNPDFGTVKREVYLNAPNKVLINGKITTLKSTQQMIEDYTGASVDSYTLATSSDLLAHALGKDLADYLLNAGFLDNTMTFEHLLELCPMSELVAEELRKTFRKPETIVTLEDVENLYKNYKAYLPTVKKAYSDTCILARFEGVEPSRVIADIQADIIANQERIIEESKIAGEYPKKKKEQDEIALKIHNLKVQIDKLKYAKAVSDREKNLAESAANKALELSIQYKNDIAQLEKDIKTLELSIENLNRPICPLSDKLTCTTDKTAIRSELMGLLNNKKDSLKMMQDKFPSILTEAKETKSTFTNLTQEKHDFELRKSMEKQQDELKAFIVELPPPPDSEKLLALHNLHKTLTEEMRNAERFADAKANEVKSEELATIVTTTKQLIEVLAPNGGIRKLILKHNIAPLQDFCNERLQQILPKWQLEFNPEKNFELEMVNPKGKISYNSLSSGEQLKVIFVLMCMLNALNGTQILLIDNLNWLDDKSLKDFVELIKEESVSFDHIFVAGLNTPTMLSIVEKESESAENSVIYL